MSTWTMPRDMSRFSSLEAELLQALHGAGLPEPEAEYQFAKGCCGHPKLDHRAPRKGRERPDGSPEPWHCQKCPCDPNREGGECLHDYKPRRRWRFDFAYPEVMLAIECEGGTWSGGRHTRGAGFEADTEKYNRAVELGWRVYRFTGSQIESGAALETIEKALEVRRP